MMRLNSGARALFAMDSRRTLLRFEASSGKRLASASLLHVQVENGVFSSDGRWFAAIGAKDNRVHLFHGDTLKPSSVLPIQAATGLAFTRDGQHLAVGAKDFSIRIVSLDSRRVVKTLTGHSKEITGLNFSPDGKRLVSIAAGDPSSAVRVWEVTTGQCLKTLQLAKNQRKVEFSPDGRLLLISHYNWIPRIFDATTGSPVHKLTGHTGDVFRARFSPDGRYVISISRDHTVRLWSVVTGREVLRVPIRQIAVDLAFSPDGRQFAVPGPEGVVLYPLELGYWRQNPRKLLNRALKAAGLHLKGSLPQATW